VNAAKVTTPAAANKMPGSIPAADLCVHRMRMPTEHFRKTWRGWVVSSEGFSVRIEGKTGLRYKEEHGEPRIDSEAMAVPRMVVVVYTRTIPNSETRPQSQVLSNLQRAFLFVGWILSPQ
jgi:hypothetical protein